MIRRIGLAASVVVLAAIAASVARASEGPGIGVRLVNLAAPATVGVPVSFGVELRANRAVTLRSFSLRGGSALGGPPVVTGLPDSLPMTPGVPVTLSLTTLPTGGDLRYKLRFAAGATAVTRTFDLSREHFDRMYRANSSVVTSDLPLPVIGPGGNDDPGPAPATPRPAALEPLRDLRTLPAGVRATTGRNVRVLGRIAYKRDDNLVVGADRVTVKILDQESGFDDLLDETRTNADGTFDVTVWSDEDAPDLYLEVGTINGAVEVQDGTWNSAYRWETGVKVDFTGATADFGTRQPPDWYLRAALNIHTSAMRAWRWYKNNTGITPGKQEYEWPSGDWPHYDPNWGDIHIPEEVGGVVTDKYVWRISTHIHEYGHFVQNEVQDYNTDHDYDNGICNNANGDPGHCAWCQEDDGTAVKEGFGNFFADQVISEWQTLYGVEPEDTRDQESLGACMDGDGNSCSCDPYRTEGHFGRLLRDLADAANDDDPLGTAEGEDLVSAGGGAVVAVFHAYDIDSPGEYISRFRQLHPEYASGALWATLANNDYLLDDNTAPSVPSGFASTDHAVGFQNTDATITMTWNPATDDFSGISAYQIWYKLASSSSWGSAKTVEGTTYTTPELAAGWYDFRIQARDRAGNVSSYGLLGSFGVRDPWPADFTSTTPAGWDANVVPRNDATATASSAAVSNVLNGGVANSYFNVVGRNIGELTSETVHQIRLLLDGVPFDSTTFNLTPAGVTFSSRNRGPRTVRGGRHTLEAWYDCDEQNIENSETNNRKGAQYTWNGEKVNTNVRVRRAAPPDRTGGHNSFTVPIGAPKWDNVDGLYYTHTRVFPTTTYSWAAMWTAPVSNQANYDCRLYLHSTTTSDGGWTDGLVTSSRVNGLLDAVITNTPDAWDVGVINTSRSSSDYLAACVTSSTTPLVVGDSITITLGDSAMMAIRGFTPPAGSSKTLIQVRRTAGTSPIYTLWLDDTHTYGTISQYSGKVGTNVSGFSELTVTGTSAAENGLVFYRNPVDGWGPVTFTVVVKAKPGDPAAVTPAGWHSALVPRPAADGTPGSVPAPLALTGETGFTYLNASFTNQSDAPTGPFRAALRVDRSSLGSLVYPFGVSANSVTKANNVYPALMTAGRHVLHMTLDSDSSLTEVSETNNRFGEQWVWAPPTSSLGSALWRRGTNGGPTEGWDACAPGEELGFNMDGLRSPVFSAATAAGWAGFAAVPTTGGDVDLHLFETASNATTGFDDALGFSQWDGSATEFVLVNFAATPYRAFDAGVVRATEDTSSYLANIVGATLRAPALGTHGPFTLPGGRVLELHAFDLPAGRHVIDLVNQSGGADLGFAAYRGPRPFQNRSDGADVASSDANGPGGHEQVVFDLPAPERVCLAVWKAGAAEQGKSAAYALALNTAWLGADTTPPASTRLLGARPTPFTTGTSVAFELAQAGEASVEVFDVQGARVRTLAAGPRAAGRHTLAWDGTGEDGRRAPPGLYLVRLRAGAVSATAKVVRAR